jgi:N-acetylmuramoyl-L-alanine amidase
MITTRFFNSIFIAAALGAAACAAPPVTTAPEPAPIIPATPPAPVARAPLPPANPTLPSVPHVAGPLEIKVVYPPAGQLIQSADSNFIFGSVGNGDAGLTINGILTPVWPNGSFMGWLPNPSADRPEYDIVATTGADTARLTHPVKIAPRPTGPPAAPDTILPISPARYASLIGPAAYASDTDRVITGYAVTGGIRRWFLIPGTIVKVVGTRGTDAFVRLDTTHTIRIEQADLKMLDTTVRLPRRIRAAAFTVQPSDEWTDIVIPVSEAPAYLVEEGPASVTLTLYDTRGPTARQRSVKGPAGSYLQWISSVTNGPSSQYIFSLSGPPYGYQPLWESGKLTFRVRNPPRPASSAPLQGLTIAVDPGHPPVGATGPTGLWEPEAVLPVGLKVRDLLQAKGVNVVMTRTTPDPVDLNLRGAIARRANAHALVSIHLNAVPDGTNPFRAQGTATYHYHLQSGALAAAVQSAAVAQLGLPDNGVKRENFALVRPTWMPAILVEGAFIIMPDQEAALRTPDYQARYAQAIVDGLEAYFRSLAPAEK